MAEPFPDSLKNVVPSLEKAKEVNFSLLLTSFVLLADCAALYVHGMNIVHLSEVPDIIKPRFAVEAVILVIVFGMPLQFAMRLLHVWVTGIIEIVGDRYEELFNSGGQRTQQDYAGYVPLDVLREKAHVSKESYHRDLLKKKYEHQHEMEQTALSAFTVLVLSGVDLCVPLSPHQNGILAQVADGLGRNGYSLLLWLCLGGILVVLAFYPMFEVNRPMVYCPSLAQELEEERRQEREKQERFRREAEEERVSITRLPSNEVGRRLSGRNSD